MIFEKGDVLLLAEWVPEAVAEWRPPILELWAGESNRMRIYDLWETTLEWNPPRHLGKSSILSGDESEISVLHGRWIRSLGKQTRHISHLCSLPDQHNRFYLVLSSTLDDRRGCQADHSHEPDDKLLILRVIRPAASKKQICHCQTSKQVFSVSGHQVHGMDDKR